MNVIPPISIIDSMLTSSSALESPPAAYVSGTTYGAGASVSVAGSLGALDSYTSLAGGNIGHAPASSPTWWNFSGTTYATYAVGTTYALGVRAQDPASHQLYESLIGGNVGNALTDETKWQAVGENNRWSMFDLLRNTATVVATPLTVVLTPGKRVNSLALLGLEATDIVVTMTSAGVTVYTHTENLIDRDTRGWSYYYYRDFTTRKSVVLFDLPPYSNGIITITINNVFANVQCGACVIGNYEYVGGVQYGAESDVLNFSKIERDDDGNSVLQAKRNVPKSNQTLWLGKEYVNRARRLRDDLNAVPAVWAGLDDDGQEYFEALLILGIYKRFTINCEMQDFAIITLELEEI
jgi:hypothetical protein